MLTLFFNCENEEQKKEKAQDVVKALIANLQVDNYESVYELYPSFKNLTGKYWKYKSIQITSTSLKDDGSVELFANSENGNQLFFVLKKVDANYKISKSKGLSSYFNSNIYKYCKNIGCIGINDSDLDVDKICTDNERGFNIIVNKIKNKIQNNTVLENHTLRKNGGYGVPFYVSGDITIKNYSRFSIPAYSYDIYIKFLNNKDDVLFEYKHYNNFSNIPFNSSDTYHVMKDVDKTFKKVSIELRVLKTNFIEELVGAYAEGSRCVYDDNL